MKILALDTSTKAQSLALVDGSSAVARRLSFVRTNHSETLLLNIDDMLAQAEWEVADLDLVAAGLGPGTFTGLRVGLATAKAIARSAEADLVGVSSLAATARPVTGLFRGTVFALCDARRGEVYTARYSIGEHTFENESDATAMTPAALRQQVDATEGPVLLVGGGLRAYPELQQWDRGGVSVLPQPWDAPSSVSIALLGALHLRDHGPADLAALEPDYVRASDAELNASRQS